MEYQHLKSWAIYLSLSGYLWEADSIRRPSSAAVDPWGGQRQHPKSLSGCSPQSVQGFQHRNVTLLSLSPKTQCHVDGTVTGGPAFASRYLIMRDSFPGDLGFTWSMSQPAIVYHHRCRWVNLKHVTCGGPRPVLPHTCRLDNLSD